MNLTKDQISRARVLVMGDVMLDCYWQGPVERISPEAPVPVVCVTQEQERLGGAGNVALNIASLGAQTSLLSVAGRDAAGKTLAALAQQAGIAVHLVHDAALQTTKKLRVIARQQQLIRLDFEGSPVTHAVEAQAALFPELLTQHDAVLFSDYGKGSLVQIASMVTQARALNKPVLIDPKGTNYSIYSGATVLTPNTQELRAVIGDWADEAELHTKAQNLREQLNLQALLMTRSEKGMTLFDAQGHLHVNAQAEEVFDVTGAGDTVIATLACLVAAGMSLRQALPWANKAAGIVVRKFGTASVSYEELWS